MDAREVNAFITHNHPDGAVGGLRAERELVSFSSAGLQLRAEGELVGVYLASRGPTPGGGTACHLGLWCVLPEARAKSLTLLHKILRQPADLVTDVTPIPNVAKVNRKLGFADLDTTAFRVPNLPLPPAQGVRLITADTQIEQVLSGFDLQAFRDHRDIPGLVHTVALVDDAVCYIVAIHHPRTMEIIYVGDRGVIQRVWSTLLTHYLVRHHRILTRAEQRVVGFRPRWARESYASPRQSRGQGPDGSEVTYLYSPMALGGVFE